MAVQIFVSYAHADMKNRPGYKGSRMSQILDDIKYDLDCHDRRSPFKILRDEEGMLHAGNNLDSEISKAIDQCDLGLVLVSASYCRSEECLAELHQLLKKDKPICIVEAEKAWDGEFEDSLRADFPDIDRTLRASFWGMRDNKAVQFGWPLPRIDSDNREDYDKALRFTVDSIENLRHEILKNRKEEPLSVLSDMDRHAVFIASPTADVKREAERLEEALKEAGFSVFRFDPKRYLPDDTDAEEALELAISKCQMSVQLLGAVPGGQMNNSELRATPLQFKLIQASSKPFHVWESPLFERAECGDEYRTFLLAAHSHRQSYEDFERYVLKQAEHLADVPETPPQDTYPIVGIDFAEPDMPVANLVMRALGKYASVTPLDFDLNCERLEKAVSDSDGIVMVYGDSRAGQKRIGAHFGIVQRFKNRNRGALFDLAIGNSLDEDAALDAPPHPRGPNVHVIFIDTDKLVVEQDALAEFVDNIKTNAAQRYQ